LFRNQNKTHFSVAAVWFSAILPPLQPEFFMNLQVPRSSTPRTRKKGTPLKK